MSGSSNPFYARAQALQAELTRRRRDFHRHPELAFAERRTAGIAAQTLRDLGLEVQTGVGRTGVIGLLEGDHPGPTVLIRADMDALPIQEGTRAEYASQQPGVMHACGHDGHTSIALAVAQMLSQERARLRGRVKFVFQPAEEIGAGAEAMIADGALRDPAPDVTLGLHLWNETPFGVVGVTPGPSMAGADSWACTISGVGGHAALPHLTRDPIAAAGQIITALQTVVSREVDPLGTAVISVAAVQAGDAFNVIPSQAVLKGTLRAFTEPVRDQLRGRISALCMGIAAAMQCQAEVTFTEMALPVINDAEVCTTVARAASETPGVQVDGAIRTMAAEDVSLFMQGIPGCYFFVGAANPALGLDAPHHSPLFDFDERALVVGAAVLAHAAASYL